MKCCLCKILIGSFLLVLNSIISFAQYNISIDASHQIKKISPNSLGINVNYLMDGTYISPGTQEATSKTLKTMGMTMIRYPGGEKSDNYGWSSFPFNKPQPKMLLTGNCQWPSGDGRFVEDDGITCKPEVLDFDEFIEMCQQVNAEPIIVCAYDAAYYGGQEGSDNPCGEKPTRQQLIENAREWVRYANKTKNYQVKYWSIGNESWNDCTYNGCVDADQYAADVIEFANEMRAVDPSIKVIANGNGTGWWRSLLQNTEAANAIDYLGVSCYPVFNYNGGYEYYRNNNPDLLGEVQVAINAINDYASSANKNRIKVIATEFNSIDWSGTWVSSNDLGHALVSFEMIGRCLEKEQVEAALFWNTRWVNNTSNADDLYDALDKNSGMNANGKMLSVWGDIILPRMVHTTEEGFVKTFAYNDSSSNKLNIVLINKDNIRRDVNVSLSGYLHQSAGERWEFKGINVNDTDPVYTLNEMIIVDQTPYAISLPANSVTVLKLSGISPSGFQSKINIKLLNNPINEIATFSVAGMNNERIKVNLFDARGIAVQRFQDITSNGIISLKIKKLVPGIYFFEFSASSFRQTIKVVRR